MSFAVIGWQCSAFTSWNWSRGGSEEILHHVGFHVMAMCYSMCHWVRKGSQIVVRLQGRRSRYPSTLGNAESKSWMSLDSGEIKTPWWITHIWAGIAVPQLSDISFHGHFANKAWSQRQRPSGKCLWNDERGAGGMRAWKDTNASGSQVKHHPELHISSVYNLHPIYLSAWLITLLLSNIEKPINSSRHSPKKQKPLTVISALSPLSSVTHIHFLHQCWFPVPLLKHWLVWKNCVACHAARTNWPPSTSRDKSRAVRDTQSRSE